MGSTLSKIAEVSMQCIFSNGVSKEGNRKTEARGHGEIAEWIESVKRLEGGVNETGGREERFALQHLGSAAYPFSQDLYWCSKSSLGNIN